MMLLAKNCVPHMRSAGGGAIVNVSSIAGLGGGHPTLLYPTAKAAVIGLTKAMAAHHGVDGIRVNCVAPGLAFTPMVESRGMSEDLREARRRSAPLAVEGNGWDVGSAVLYLASPAARWVTGVVLPVDGGISATIPIQTPPRAVLVEGSTA
jgi:NAD(P)-dependent dehydrogenase (short-subunit alcohol dehydrogenase family)